MCFLRTEGQNSTSFQVPYLQGSCFQVLSNALNFSYRINRCSRIGTRWYILSAEWALSSVTGYLSSLRSHNDSAPSWPPVATMWGCVGWCAMQCRGTLSPVLTVTTQVFTSTVYKLFLQQSRTIVQTGNSCCQNVTDTFLSRIQTTDD